MSPAAQEHTEETKVYHRGPNGTPLTGFGVAQLNQFHLDIAATVKLPPVDPLAVENTPHTQQGVDVVPYSIVEGPQNWKGPEFSGPENAHKWQYRLTPSDIAELDNALATIKQRGIKIEDLKKEDFELPTLGPKLVEIGDDVLLGKGFHLIKGFPTDRYTRWETIAAYYAFGLYWGNTQAQNAKGHIVGHIRDLGTDKNQVGVRPYTSTVSHGFHADNADIAALLCLQEAKEGGVTSWVSSITIHNELLRRGRKDLVEVLTTGEYWVTAYNAYGAPDDKFSKEPNSGWINFPAFYYHKNRLIGNFKEGKYYYIYAFPEAPKFTELQEEALRTFVALARCPELRLDFKLEPGDLGLVNNISVLHAKTAFVDHDDPAKKRHLLRLWVAPPNGPELPEDSGYTATWGTVTPGNRGGYRLAENQGHTVPLESEYGDLESTRPKAEIPDIFERPHSVAPHVTAAVQAAA